MLKLFKLANRKRTADTPVYMLKDGQFFRTVYHPNGWSDQPDYDLGNDGKIYRTKNHPHGIGDLPDYEFGTDRKLYRTHTHPDGNWDMPEFEITD